jgi:sugar transferase (PEP-CTERM/EpsH1 system associated)
VELLYLSHCVPGPPDKGEKIRAHFELNELARRHAVHLACFARTPEEIEDARKLVDRCASVYVAPLFPFALHVAGAGLRFAVGACMNTAFYDSQAMRGDIAALMKGRKITGAVSYTAVMAPYVPEGLPFVLDLTDVDSEKWYQYGRERKPGFLFRAEAWRIRRLEQEQAGRAGVTLVTTGAEEALFRSIAPKARTAVMENGVDFGYFDPERVGDELGLSGRNYVAFVGSMDYYPNQQAVIDFVDRVFPALRAREPGLELLIVGRSPSPKVMALAREAGVDVVGSVDDVRPYYRWAKGTVAPLGIARGIQNKVLEALAMDRPVWASEAVCRTFGERLPEGVMRCASVEDYSRQSEAVGIRKRAMTRFSWGANLGVLTKAVYEMAEGR